MIFYWRRSLASCSPGLRHGGSVDRGGVSRRWWSWLKKLDTAKDRPGPERFQFVVAEVSEMLDDCLDEIPEWSKLEEDQRDRILGGLVELCLFIHRSSYKKKTGAA